MKKANRFRGVFVSAMHEVYNEGKRMLVIETSLPPVVGIFREECRRKESNLTTFRPPGFESGASASSATPACSYFSRLGSFQQLNFPRKTCACGFRLRHRNRHYAQHAKSGTSTKL